MAALLLMAKFNAGFKQLKLSIRSSRGWPNAHRVLRGLLATESHFDLTIKKAHWPFNTISVALSLWQGFFLKIASPPSGRELICFVWVAETSRRNGRGVMLPVRTYP